MLRMLSIGLAALGCVVAQSASSQADVYLRVPLVRVYSGPSYYPSRPSFSMRIPFVLRLDVNQPPRLVAPPVIVLQSGPVVPVPNGQPPIEIAPAPALVAPAKALSHEEFAAAFKPLPGTHEVVLLHPGTNQPVNVVFTLPQGTPKVHVLRRALIFDYGRQEVEIRFQTGGRVKVVSR